MCYGAVLSCTNCPSHQIDFIKFHLCRQGQPRLSWAPQTSEHVVHSNVPTCLETSLGSRGKVRTSTGFGVHRVSGLGFWA